MQVSNKLVGERDLAGQGTLTCLHEWAGHLVQTVDSTNSITTTIPSTALRAGVGPHYEVRNGVDCRGGVTPPLCG